MPPAPDRPQPDTWQHSSWLVLDYPTADEVTLPTGVLSLRGWAWSHRVGRGRLWLTIEAPGQADRRISVRRRIWRPDVSKVIPEIPGDNYAGFEISVDRFDLPRRSTVRLHFDGGSRQLVSRPIRVRALHQNRIDGRISIACNACGGLAFTEFGRKDNLALVRCQSCGLVFTNPQPEPAQIQARYSDDYFEREYLPGVLNDLEAHRLFWQMLLGYVTPYRNYSPHLFEAGAGSGYALLEAAKNGWQASGIDLNPHAVAFARETLGLDVRQGDISQISLPADHFGAIMLESTLEHFVDPAAVIGKCARALHPGGALLIWTLTCEGNHFAQQGMDYRFCGPSEHLYYFTAASLCRMCEAAGLRVQKIEREESSDSILVLASRLIGINENDAE